MSPGILGPFDVINPQQILTQYSDWIYFTLILVLFLAVAGITLRRHFDRPYVKPLIIAVGLMLTVAVFLKRDWLVILFDGLGVIGLIILVAVVAVTVYGMIRGFGLGAGKAFYVTYVLFYVLSWLKASALYLSLSEHRLGIINVALLFLFFYCIYQLTPFGHASKSLKGRTNDRFSDASAGIDRDIQSQKAETKAVAEEAWPLTKREIKTVEELSEVLAEIQVAIERGQGQIATEDRAKIAKALGNILRKESLFRNDLTRLQQVVSKLSRVDSDELENLRKRLKRAGNEEKIALRAEIQKEDLKLQAEKQVGDCDQRLAQAIEAFHRNLAEAAGIITNSPYHLDSKPFMARARVALKEIQAILNDVKRLEDRIVTLSQDERRLLKHERRVAA